MKRFSAFVLFCCITLTVFAQNTVRGEVPHTGQSSLFRVDGNSTTRSDNESTPASGTETVTFTSTSEGIYITILSGKNNIKLFALTGQLLLNGDLTQGRFFIPTRKGIYFLKINNKSFKVICR